MERDGEGTILPDFLNFTFLYHAPSQAMVIANCPWKEHGGYDKTAHEEVMHILYSGTRLKNGPFTRLPWSDDPLAWYGGGITGMVDDSDFITWRFKGCSGSCQAQQIPEEMLREGHIPTEFSDKCSPSDVADLKRLIAAGDRENLVKYFNVKKLNKTKAVARTAFFPRGMQTDAMTMAMTMWKELHDSSLDRKTCGEYDSDLDENTEPRCHAISCAKCEGQECKALVNIGMRPWGGRSVSYGDDELEDMEWDFPKRRLDEADHIPKMVCFRQRMRISTFDVEENHISRTTYF